ncbi:MAG TPA: inositol monophosphatase family protein [Chloroflexota bacterium]|nr:inositol monophosphatase family protein [Chloroflexota bacterium]
MSLDYTAALTLAIRLAEEAGALLRAEFHRPGGPRGARGHADIDLEAEAYIRQQLCAAFPTWGYRGEETRPHLPPRDPEAHLWLVDPNDGTASYLRGQRGSAVSIALLRQGLPVLGVVYAPCAPDDAGDLLAWAEGCGPPRRNGQPLPPPAWPERLDAHTVVLLTEGAERRAAAHLEVIAPARFRALPSVAYRLALAAAGEGAAAVSLHTPGDWDYAAAHALLRAVGGVFLDQDGAPVAYTLDGRSQTQRCFGGAPAIAAELVRRPWHYVQEASAAPWPDPALPFDLLRGQPGAHVADAALLARAQGCLLGLLAGAALGALVEGEEAPALRRRYPEGLRALVDGGPYQLIAGQPAAAGEQALVLARSIVQAGGYSAEAATQGYAWWAGTDPPGQTAADSPLARLAPLALWGHRLTPEALAAAARADCALTDPHPVCADAGALLAVVLAHAVAGRALETVPCDAGPAAVYAAAVAWAQAVQLAPSIRAALAAARAAPPAAVSGHDAPAILQNAFYQLLHAPSVEEGLVQTVMRGGPASAWAAVAGALLGAVHTRAALPAAWQRLILSCRPLAEPPRAPCPRPRPLWPVDALVLAERLLVAGRPGE